MKKIKYIFILMFFINNITVSAQNDTIEFKEQSNRGTQLINFQTTKFLYPKAWTFELQHRFGQVGFDSTLSQEFLGLDLPSVIRFSFGYSVNDKLYIKIGRTNYLKTYDLEAKYSIMRQTVEKKNPISIALFVNAALRSEKFPNVPKNAVFEDSAKFKYRPSHRLSYSTSLIISRQFNEQLYFQVVPTFVYQNLANPYTDNFTMGTSAGFSYKISNTSAIVSEYGVTFNNKTENYYYPFSVGFEFGTVNHAFQVFVSNTNKILENHVYTTENMNMLDGNFLFGFNMSRNFWRKN